VFDYAPGYEHATEAETLKCVTIQNVLRERRIRINEHNCDVEKTADLLPPDFLFPTELPHVFANPPNPRAGKRRRAFPRGTPNPKKLKAAGNS